MSFQIVWKQLDDLLEEVNVDDLLEEVNIDDLLEEVNMHCFLSLA